MLLRNLCISPNCSQRCEKHKTCDWTEWVACILMLVETVASEDNIGKVKERDTIPFSTA